ncbi:MAG: NADH-quinone oxidoreductase subunit M, partial [Alistipes sp.]|nr:NADH-quinone oxidoreductase subunit M [Alistipes sp.]
GTVFSGAVAEPHHRTLTDAVWFERLSVGVLSLAIAAIGLAPLWVSNMIQGSLTPVIQQLMR